jgi:hypothetical protein
MKKRLDDKWARAGFHFKLDWLLRNINTALTGEALFSAMEDVSSHEFSRGLDRAEEMVDKLLNLISSPLGLDHPGSRKPLLVPAAYQVLSRSKWESYRSGGRSECPWLSLRDRSRDEKYKGWR